MIAEIIARLNDNVPALKLVAGAASFIAAEKALPKATPAAFVVMLHETADPAYLLGVMAQRVTATLGVILVVGNVSDATGAAASIDLAALRVAVRAALHGWAPGAACAPLQIDGGHLLKFDSASWWIDAWRTTYEART